MVQQRKQIFKNISMLKKLTAIKLKIKILSFLDSKFMSEKNFLFPEILQFLVYCLTTTSNIPNMKDLVCFITFPVSRILLCPSTYKRVDLMNKRVGLMNKFRNVKNFRMYDVGARDHKVSLHSNVQSSRCTWFVNFFFIISIILT